MEVQLPSHWPPEKLVVKIRYHGPGARTPGRTMLRVTVNVVVEPLAPLEGDAKPLPGQLPLMSTEYQVSTGLPSPTLLAERPIA